MDFIKCAVNDFTKDGYPLFLRFFGNGEPTLEFDKIMQITDYCKQIDKDAVFELQTNGFFGKEKLEWIGDNIDIVWISYDGTTQVNDFYRPAKNNKPVSEIIESNIRYLVKKVKQLGIRATIGNKNLYKQMEIVDKMEELGINYAYTDLMFADIKNKKYYEEETEAIEYAKEFIAAHRYASQKLIFYGSFFMINFDRKTDIFCRACLPMPHLTTDGYVSCCDMGYKGGNMESLIYGEYDYNNNIIHYDRDKLDYIRKRTADRLEKCNDCEAKYYCAGGCIGEAINENGDIYSIKDKNCEAIRYLLKELKDTAIPVLHP
jgi:uncharacterized protein